MPKLYEIDLEKGVEGTPIPPVFERTVHIPAGAITFGVEYRWLTFDVARENFELNVAEGRQVLDDINELVVDPAEGVSVHVFASEGGEYLRFDCFDVEPHYHYIDPEAPWVNRFTFDPVAHGDMLDWTLDCLRNRLVPMLERTEPGARLAQQLDLATVAAALDEVERVARATAADRSHLVSTSNA
jgi:hypothetical protein